MRGWTMLAIAVAIAACFVISGHTPCLAASDSSAAEQHPALSDIDARRQALLRQMINSPGDLDLAYDYAQLSAQVGDYEGAISTLERVLIYAPNTPRVELELGILYYQIGSYDVARSYFATVLADPNVPPAITAQVNVYLQQLAVQAEPPPFSATIYTAIRWESNANAAPSNQSVTLNGINFTLDQTAVAASDWSSVNVGTIHYSYDLKNQGDRIEFDAIGYNASYFKLTDIDLDFFEATLGPSFNLKRIGMDKSRLFGGGIRLLNYAGRGVLDARLETRYRDFNDTTLRPTSSLRTGLQTRLGGTYS